MPRQAHWATEEQTELLISHFSEYVNIYNSDKNYGHFWARIKEEWFKRFPMDAGTMFPEKLDSELTTEDKGSIGSGIKKVMKVWIIPNNFKSLFSS